MSRLSTLSGVLVVLASLGLTQTGPCPGGGGTQDETCTTVADCDQGEVCETAACVIDEGETEGVCEYTAACEDDHCTDEGCVECIGDDECDDENACNGVETCGDDGACADGTALSCDDGLFCNGAETCDADTGCVDGAEPCDPATETCDEDNDTCTITCDQAEDCDDGDPCTDDLCVNNGCQNDAVDCDNGDFCDGTESCDGTTGDCVSSGDPCAADQTCNEDTDTCDDQPPCETDADCDDGVFCNGTETCDVDAGGCVAGTDPCAETVCTCQGEAQDPVCEEGDAAASCSCPTCPTIDFTLSQDNLSGSTGDDVFSAPLLFNAPSGTQVASLQTGDSANGLAGADVLNATLNAAATVVPTTIAGIETINVTDFAGATLSAGGISGVDTINSVNSTATFSVTALQELADWGMSGVNNAAVGMNMTFGLAATTSGSSDTITGTLTGSTVGTVNITTAAGTTNGFETLALVSTGSAANTLTTLTQTNGTTMATANISGAQALTVNTLPNTIRTYNASTMTGALQLGSGTSAATYATFATANLTQFTGGSGNDVLIFANTLDTNDFSAQTADLGAGTDVVQATFGADLLTSSPFRNLEEFRVNATANASVNFNGATGLANLTVEGDGTGNALTLQNVPATGGVFPTLNFRGANTQAAQTYDTVTYTAVGNTGSSDTLTVNVNNRGTALNASGTTNGHTTGALTANGFETVSITCADGPCTFGGVRSTTLVTLNVTGSSNVTLGEVDLVTASNDATSSILTVNAANVSGNFSATVMELATGGNITTGNGNDTIVVSSDSGATSSNVSLGSGNDSYTGDSDTDSADTVTAGAGTDTIQAGDGNDTIATGADADTVVYDQTTADDREDVTDFAAGTGGDEMQFDQSDLSLNGVTETVGTIAAIGAAGTFINIQTGAGAATDAAAETAFNGASALGDGVEYVLVYFNTTDNSTHIIYDADADTDGGAVLLGRLTNITTQAGHDQLTAANIDNQP